MLIADDTDAIGAALARLETETKNRFKPKPLTYDAATNAGQFIWQLIQSGEALNAVVWPAIVHDDHITENDLKTPIDMYSFIRWLSAHSEAIERMAARNVTAVSNNGDTLENLKIVFCRLRILQLL